MDTNETQIGKHYRIAEIQSGSLTPTLSQQPGGTPKLLTGEIMSDSLSLVTMQADTVAASYDTIPGNDPTEYGNQIGIWQDSDVPIDPSDPGPIKSTTELGSSPTGSGAINGLKLMADTDYVVCYATGKEWTTICAYFVAQVGDTEPSETGMTTVTLKEATQNTVTVEYSAVDNAQPKTYGYWLGLWDGSIYKWTKDSSMKTVEPSDDNQQSTVTFTQVTIQPDTWYTVAIASGSAETDLCAWVKFKTASTMF